MSSPQLENGYTKIANELLDALCRIRISGEARQVLDFIIRKTYGFNKKEDIIALSQICLGTGLKKSTTCKATNKLISMNMITKKDNALGNIYRFNKDFDSWKPLPKKITLPKKEMSVTKKGNNRYPKRDIQKKLINIKETVAEVNSAVWDFKEALKKLDNSPRRDLNIISLYWKNKDPRLTNRLQAEIELKRCLRPAKLLTPYEDDRLVDTMEWLKKNADFKWTLESVQKYITEDLSKLKKKNG